jgi:hypothetical protein
MTDTINWCYRTIKFKARRSGRSVKDLLALCAQNDPFYMGQKAQFTKAEWFANLWNAGVLDGCKHLRAMHYRLLSGSEPIMREDGKPYENTDACAEYLNYAAKVARYLEMVDPRAFTDRKSAPALIFTAEAEQATIDIDDEDFFDLELPEFPEVPAYRLEGFTGAQEYMVEVWIEKSTMQDELLPLCEKYKCNLVTGVGELSISQCIALVDRVIAFQRPCRILYISDFDPGGRSMPVAVARKIEFYQREGHPDLDIQVNQILLTEDQCRHYKLPRTPIKESELRGAKFEAQYGEGATELDALEAIHPGEFSKIVETEIIRFYDDTLDGRVEEAENDLLDELDELRQGIVDGYDDKIAGFEAEYDEIKEEFEPKIRGLKGRIKKVWQAIRTEMDDADLPDIDVPKAEIDTENEWSEPLYDSSRDYEEQIEHYKMFQNGESSE